MICPVAELRTQETDLLIVGAGPTGLGAAWFAHEQGVSDWLLAEASDHLGGLSASITDDQGFTWDQGGHVLFSHYDTYDRVFETLMGGEYTTNQRESWVHVAATRVPYPFQRNIHRLPEALRDACLQGLRAISKGGGVNSGRGGDFDAHNRAVFGEAIADLFMTPYNTKVWATHPNRMSTNWLGQRVAQVDLERIERNIARNQDDVGWGPNNTFRFPMGGTGDFFSRFMPYVQDNLELNTRLASIDPDSRTAAFERDGKQFSVRYERLISTVPLDLLLGSIITSAPDHVRDAATGLRSVGGRFTGIGIEKPCPSTASWLYFPEKQVPFYRVTYLSNYSPRMTPDPDRYFSLLCETSFSPEYPDDEATIAQRTIDGLKRVGMLEDDDPIASVWTMSVPRSYPVPTLDRDERLGVILPWLESRAISSRGRFGLWKYEVANTDHSFMQGYEAARQHLTGEPETTTGITYDTDDDGSSIASMHRPEVAGSGERRVR